VQDDTDSRWQDIVSQVDAALGDAGIHDDTTRAALLDGVREAMAELGTAEPPPTNVEPFPGTPPPPQPPPHTARILTRSSGGSGRGGQIRVAAGERQTILHAQAPRAYRLHGTSGTLRVHADGQPLATLRAGQSIDVEAALIQVSGEAATDSGDARGRYARLTAGRG